MQLFLDRYGSIITWLGIGSTFTFVLSLIIIPWIIHKLDKDFFIQLREPKKKESEHPVRFILLCIMRYSMGLFLLLAGILMIFLPGQGILTILFGISLLDFPAKRTVTIRLLSCQSVQSSLNWIRKKGNRTPFSFT
jgi:Na+-transporting methylmalonyl-CoA/oxaloacetate decarboxylase gamma subunit